MAKRFTFKDAKAKIAELEAQIETLNVDLTDNVVTAAELKVLRVYKYALVVSVGINLLTFLALVF